MISSRVSSISEEEEEHKQHDNPAPPRSGLHDIARDQEEDEREAKRLKLI